MCGQFKKRFKDPRRFKDLSEEVCGQIFLNWRCVSSIFMCSVDVFIQHNQRHRQSVIFGRVKNMFAGSNRRVPRQMSCQKRVAGVRLASSRSLDRLLNHQAFPPGTPTWFGSRQCVCVALCLLACFACLKCLNLNMGGTCKPRVTIHEANF
jgi:hypothetical protein